MKKVFCILLSILLLASCAVPAFASGEDAVGKASFGAYKHVYIIGIDGAGRFFKDADTPNFDRIFCRRRGGLHRPRGDDHHQRAELGRDPDRRFLPPAHDDQHDHG